MNVLSHIDYLALAAATVAVFALLFRTFWRERCHRRVVWATSLLVAMALGAGWFLVEAAGKRGDAEMRMSLASMAPEFAETMSRLGHAQVGTQNPAESPSYLRLVLAQTGWIANRPLVQRTHTLRKLPDGRLAAVFDLEQDRSAPDDATLKTGEKRAFGGAAWAWLEPVFEGEASFHDEPVVDGRGTWVRGAAPLLDDKKNVEAVAVVEFAAADLLGANAAGRRRALILLGGILFMMALTTVLAAQALSIRKRMKERATALHECETLQGQIAAMQIQQRKLEQLVNSIDGIVWEADARSARFTFVSQQSEAILGFTPQQCLTEGFWAGRLHSEDAWVVEHRRKLVARRRHYSFDYRMIAADGSTVWIRETAAAVADGNQEPVLVHGAFLDITKARLAAEELDAAHRALVESSRNAGMAEVATGVLHNVGNVLNSVNTSGALIRDKVNASKVADLTKISGLLNEHQSDFATFIATDPRGKFVPELVSRVADALRAEQVAVQAEVDAITRNIGHIKDIVFLQQIYSKGASAVEAIDVVALVEHALQINAASLAQHEVKIVREFEPVPPAFVEKHKALQILVNLIRNAEQAVDQAPDERTKTLTLRIDRPPATNRVRIVVMDNGVGIAPHDLNSIFSHGFTTKKSGHGFGLHSGALAAKEMGGTLIAESEGCGRGAVFTLELPTEPHVSTIEATAAAEAA